MGGISLFAFLYNSIVNQYDVNGLRTEKQQCEKGVELFWKYNPSWKTKIVEMAENCGKVNVECVDCCKNNPCRNKTSAGCFVGGKEKKDDDNIYICYNLNYQVYPLTLAHELVHYADNCNEPLEKCELGEDLSLKKYFTCYCARSLCKEMRAFRNSNQCKSWDACWELVANKMSYYQGAGCDDLGKEYDFSKDIDVKDKVKAMCPDLTEGSFGIPKYPKYHEYR